MLHRSLLVFPDDTAESIIASINGAQSSLRIKMFLFSDPAIIEAVLRAHHRGIVVRIILNPARRNGKEENALSRNTFESAGIFVKDSNPAFGITHEKSMVVDGNLAFVNSLNWEVKNLTKTRDYAILTRHPAEVQEIMACFDADWDRTNFDGGDQARLIWCPDNGRARIARFIDEAKRTLFVQNERYQDMVIIERLVRAANRGVSVHVMTKAPHTLKPEKLIEGVGGLRIMHDVGIKIHKLKKLKLHGKLLLADNNRAIVGSINLTPGSFDDRRELAIEVDEPEIISRLKLIADRDWQNSRKLDLSDEGLMKDLKRRADKTELLVLGDGKKVKY